MPRYTADDLNKAARHALNAETDPGTLGHMRELKKTARKLARIEQQKNELEAQRDELIFNLTAAQVSRLALAGLAQRTPDRIDSIKRAQRSQKR